MGPAVDAFVVFVGLVYGDQLGKRKAIKGLNNLGK